MAPPMTFADGKQGTGIHDPHMIDITLKRHQEFHITVLQGKDFQPRAPNAFRCPTPHTFARDLYFSSIMSYHPLRQTRSFPYGTAVIY